MSCLSYDLLTEHKQWEEHIIKTPLTELTFANWIHSDHLRKRCNAVCHELSYKRLEKGVFGSDLQGCLLESVNQQAAGGFGLLDGKLQTQALNSGVYCILCSYLPVFFYFPPHFGNTVLCGLWRSASTSRRADVLFTMCTNAMTSDLQARGHDHSPGELDV